MSGDKVWAVRSGKQTLSYHHSLRRAQASCAAGQEVIRLEGETTKPFWKPPAEQQPPATPMKLMLDVR